MLHTERQRSGPVLPTRVGLHNGSEPRALGAKCSVTLALERVTIASPFCLFVGPPTEEASLLLGTDNIRFASCVPF